MTDKMSEARWYGWALALSATFASSIVTPLVKGAVVGGMDPITLLLLRLAIAVALMVVTTLLTEPQFFRLDRRGVWVIGAVGLISGVEICCFFWSLSYVDASMTAMIKSTQPLLVLLLLAFGGEQLKGRHWLRLAFATLGIYLLVGPGGQVAPFGLFLLALSLLLYAAQLVFIQWWLADYDPRTLAIYLNGTMLLVIIVWWGAMGARWQSPTRQDWLIIAILALVSTYFARLALFGAIRRIGSGQIALLWPLQTLLVIILSVLFLGERMRPLQWLGGGLILVSAFLAIEYIAWPKWRTRNV